MIRKPRRFAVAALALAIFPLALLGQQEEAAPEEEPGVQVLARGPVHEAFAQPSNTKPEPSALVPKKPPAPIPEVPPDQKPEGDKVIWIPGYWAWDLEAKDYMWVSGIWRTPPPGRKWVPGYWHAVEDGWQWVAGLWAAEKQPDLRYTETPPASLDNGPNAPDPENSSWIPGTWIWRDGTWAWRPGFWLTNNPNYMYVSPSYSWTPGGCVFTDGYWDYNLVDRGLLFAPVCFTRPLWNNANWCYRPSCIVNCGGLFDSLWFGPGCGSYFFGNYYSRFYRGCGFQPWCFQGPRCYDSLYSHCNWNNRNNQGWGGNLQRNCNARFAGTAAAPPSTFAGQNRGGGQGNGQGSPLVTSLDKAGKTTSLSRVSGAEREQFHAKAGQLQQSSVNRGKLEGSGNRLANNLGNNNSTKPMGQSQGTGSKPASGTESHFRNSSTGNPGQNSGKRDGPTTTIHNYGPTGNGNAANNGSPMNNPAKPSSSGAPAYIANQGNGPGGQAPIQSRNVQVPSGPGPGNSSPPSMSSIRSQGNSAPSGGGNLVGSTPSGGGKGPSMGNTSGPSGSMPSMGGRGASISSGNSGGASSGSGGMSGGNMGGSRGGMSGGSSGGGGRSGGGGGGGRSGGGGRR